MLALAGREWSRDRGTWEEGREERGWQTTLWIEDEGNCQS